MARRATPTNKPRTARKKRRFGRLLFGVLGSGLVLFVLVWYAVHHFDWAGPLLANSLRSVFGDDNVARLEDFVYGAEDRVNRLLKKNEPPKTYWRGPAGNNAPRAAGGPGGAAGAPPPPPPPPPPAPPPPTGASP